MNDFQTEHIRFLKTWLSEITDGSLPCMDTDKSLQLARLQSHMNDVMEDYYCDRISALETELAKSHGLTDDDDWDEFADDDGAAFLLELHKIDDEVYALTKQKEEKQHNTKKQREEKISELKRMIAEADADLEREKGKRIKILVLTSIVLTGILLSILASTLETVDIYTVLAVLLMSILGGGSFPILYICFYSIVTCNFTSISTLQDSIKSLEYELRMYESEDHDW